MLFVGKLITSLENGQATFFNVCNNPKEVCKKIKIGQVLNNVLLLNLKIKNIKLTLIISITLAFKA